MKKFLSFFLAFALTFSSLSGMAYAKEEGAASKLNVEVQEDLLKAGSVSVTEENMTEDQPLASGTADSTLFRIPAMIALDNGDLLAVADARWTTSADWGGLDTIASVSSDNGKTWYYSFPIYFPDSNTTYPGMEVATTAIDPVIVQGNDGTIYCIADMNPSGITTGDIMPAYGTGFVQVNGEWRLALTGTYTKPNENNAASYGDPANYEYYVGDFDAEGFASVLNMADGSETAYVVDEWYNIYKFNETKNVYEALTQTMVNDSTVIQQNAFYKDSELHVFNTGYLWLVTSTDNGRTWENPTILNTQIKRSTDRALLASPGQGMVASNGDIIIPFYDHGDGQENASIIWSSDNGATWTRSNDVAGMWSSESEMVEVYNGVLRLFFRNGNGTICYADFTKTGDTWVAGTGVNTGISVTSTCNVTAITHSEEIDGKKVVMVACPGGSGRTNGKLFTFLVSEDNSMELYNTYSINTGNYAYSCMTEMSNGNIGLLWEDQAASIRFDELELDVVLGYKKNIVIDAGEVYVEENAAEKASEITQESDETIATVENEFIVEDTSITLYDHVSNTKASLSSFATTPNVSLNLAKAEVVLENVSGNTYKAYNEATGKYFTKATQAYVTLADNANEAANQLLLTPTTAEDGSVTYRMCRASDAARYTVFYFTNMDFNTMGDYQSWSDGSYELVLLEKQEAVSENDVIPGYTRAASITSGNTYLISYIWTDGSVIVLCPGENSTGGQAKLVGDPVTVAKNVLTITGVAPGETTAVVDGVLYDITVLDPALSPSYAGNDYPVEKLTPSAGSEQNSSTEGPVRFALDGNPETHFHSAWSPKCTDDQLWIQLELEEAVYVTGLRYLPRANAGNGTVSEYEVFYSMDGETWTTGATGKWAVETGWKAARFEEPVLAKFVKLFAVNSTGDSNGRHMSAGEIRVTYTGKVPEVTPTPDPEPTPEPEDVSDIYPDVKDGAWYEVGVQFVYDNGLMSGSNGLFNPTADITRAQIVTTLYRLAGEPDVTDTKAFTDFTDVAEGKYYTDAVCWAYANGVATGNNGKFDPTGKLTRQQMAAFFFRYADVCGMDTTARGDYSSMVNADKVSGYAAEPLGWAVGEGLISGSDVTVNGVAAKDLNPRGNTTRAQVATILMRFCEK